MDVKVDKKRLKASVIKDGKTIKEQDLTKEQYKELMLELSGDNVDMLRTATKLFKVKSYTFKDVR